VKKQNGSIKRVGARGGVPTCAKRARLRKTTVGGGGADSGVAGAHRGAGIQRLPRVTEGPRHFYPHRSNPCAFHGHIQPNGPSRVGPGLGQEYLAWGQVPPPLTAPTNMVRAFFSTKPRGMRALPRRTRDERPQREALQGPLKTSIHRARGDVAKRKP